MRVGIVGTGNVASHLAKSLEKSGVKVVAVASRDLKRAKEFCAHLYEAVPLAKLDFTASKADVVFLAVKDEAISRCASEVKAGCQSVLAHLSGAKSLGELDAPYRKAVFYPLYSFSKSSLVNWKDVTFFIESQNPEDFQKLAGLAKALGSKFQAIEAEQKKALHIAAVFAQNFGNHFLKIASDICQAEGIPFQALKPLVENGIQKCFQVGPEKSQTGPAVRNDSSTLESHIRFLEGNPELQKLYRLVSEHIISTYQED